MAPPARAGSLSNSSGRVQLHVFWDSGRYGTSGPSPRPRLARSDGGRRHQQPAVGTFDPERVEQRAAVVAVGGRAVADGAHPAFQRRTWAPELRWDISTHAVGTGKPVAYAAPLRRILQLDVVALTSALLLGLAGVAAVHRAPLRGPGQRRALDGGAVRELGAVVG